MESNNLRYILSLPESPKLEFKREWYTGGQTLDDRGWGEFIKDLIDLANGHVEQIGKAAYLIVGADDNDPLSGKIRTTFHIPRIGMLSDLQKLRQTTLRKLRETCSPSIPDLYFEFVLLEDTPVRELLVITLLPAASLLKLDRDLSTRGLTFKKGTVLIRVGQDIGVADPTEIQAFHQAYLGSHYSPSLTFPDETTCRSITHWLDQTEPRQYRKEGLTRTIFDKDRMLGFFEDGNFVDQCLLYLETRGVNLCIFDAIALLKRRRLEIDTSTLINNRRTIIFVRKINAVPERDQMSIYAIAILPEL